MPLKSDKCKSEGEIGRLHPGAQKLRRLKPGARYRAGLKKRRPKVARSFQAEVVGKDRYKIHQTLGLLFSHPCIWRVGGRGPGVKG